MSSVRNSLPVLIEKATQIINEEKPNLKELQQIYLNIREDRSAEAEIAGNWVAYEYARLFKEKNKYGKDITISSFEETLENQFSWKRESVRNIENKWETNWQSQGKEIDSRNDESLPLKKFILEDFVYQIISLHEEESKKNHVSKYALNEWIEKDKEDGKIYDGALAEKIQLIKLDPAFNLLPIVNRKGQVIPLKELDEMDNAYLIDLLVYRQQFVNPDQSLPIAERLSLKKLTAKEFFESLGQEQPQLQIEDEVEDEKEEDEKEETTQPAPNNILATIKNFAVEIVSFILTIGGSAAAGFAIGGPIGALIGLGVGIASWFSGYGLLHYCKSEGLIPEEPQTPLEDLSSTLVEPPSLSSPSRIAEGLGIGAANLPIQNNDNLVTITEGYRKGMDKFLKDPSEENHNNLSREASTSRLIPS